MPSKITLGKSVMTSMSNFSTNYSNMLSPVTSTGNTSRISSRSNSKPRTQPVTDNNTGIVQTGGLKNMTGLGGKSYLLLY